MALIKCPECGKEISDRAKSCPNCGFPITDEKENQTRSDERVPELPPEERPEMFECVECGRPLPVGIEQCPYCNHVYQDNYRDKLLEESETGIFGRKNLICPSCGSKKIIVNNDIPVWRKALDGWVLGTVMPDTKMKYRKNMVYVCKVCGYSWKPES